MLDVRTAADRFHTNLGWLDSHHCFSFGHHYDPANVGHGLLLVSNDDVVAPGGGFGTHGHRDMEIVTWVLSGSLEHRDSEGNHGVIRRGLAQRMSAGTGIRHSEMNASNDEPVHFLQMWVPPDRSGIEPSYEQNDVSASLDAGGLVAVASGAPEVDAGVRIHQQGATLWVAVLEPGQGVELGRSPHHHVYVAEGSAALDGVELGTGDAARLVEEAPTLVGGVGGAHVAIWATA